ncbi:hypothetical protein ACIRF8_10495 [Streptomyces sp. NPDC102406]|uniref:hypothetical protein n=1 Tax=Streptomyces sp. NPDC102406 TaxID=3366171 RepID=UPI0038066C29
MAVTPLAIGVAASTAGAEPRPPASASAASTIGTRTATVVTELSAQETSAGPTGATVRVEGRLVEGETMLFPLSRLAVSVRISGEDPTSSQKCNTTTTREGRFSCTFEVAAHRTTSATATFAGNALFAPGTATTSVAGADQNPAPPAAAAPLAAPPSATPPPTAAH